MNTIIRTIWLLLSIKNLCGSCCVCQVKKKPTNTTAGAIKLFQEIYPNMKQKEIEMLATMHTKKECKDIAEEYNIQGIKF